MSLSPEPSMEGDYFFEEDFTEEISMIDAMSASLDEHGRNLQAAFQASSLDSPALRDESMNDDAFTPEIAIMAFSLLEENIDEDDISIETNQDVATSQAAHIELIQDVDASQIALPEQDAEESKALLEQIQDVNASQAALPEQDAEEILALLEPIQDVVASQAADSTSSITSPILGDKVIHFDIAGDVQVVESAYISIKPVPDNTFLAEKPKRRVYFFWVLIRRHLVKRVYAPAQTL
jgi:hypothetical protein